MKSHRRLIIFIMKAAIGFLVTISQTTWAQDLQTENPSGLVEVQYQNDYHEPYLERRNTNGFLVDLNYSNYAPTGYLSTIDNGTYKTVYENNPIGLAEVQLAYKYNFALGSLTFGLGYGAGNTSSQGTSFDRTIEITKTSLGIGYIMDAIFEAPYVAPYVQMQAWQMHIKESTPSTSSEGDTKVGFTYTIGAMFQLNWVDQDTAERGAHSFGLENTYLSLFVTKYSKTQSTADADTESDFSFGAGLRLEY